MLNYYMNDSGKIDPFVLTNIEKQVSASAQVPPPQTMAQSQPAPQEVQPQNQQPQPQLIQNYFVPPPVFETSDVDDSNDFGRETLIFDENNEHMVLITTKGKEKFKHTESPDARFGVRVNNRHSIKRNTVDKILSNGCVRLVRVYCLIDEHGNESPLQCEVEIIYHELIGRISLPVEAILRKDKSIQNALAKAGLSFVGDGFKIWCEKFSEQLGRAKVQTEHTGFYKDADGTWKHVNAGDIALRSVDSQGTLERLGIDFSIESDDNFLRLTLFLQGISGRIFTVVRSMNVFPIAMLAIVYPERGAALGDLKALYCVDGNPPLYPGKLFENQILSRRDEVVLISLSSSPYMNNKSLEILSQHGSELTAVPLLLSENEGDFSGRNDVLRLNYDLTGIGAIEGELCWTVKTLLNSTELAKALPKRFDYYCTLVKEDTETVSVKNIIALLLSLAELYLPHLGVTGKLNSVLKRYHKYLIDSAYSSSQMVIEQLKRFMVSRRDIPLIRFDSNVNPNDKAVFLKGNMVLFSRKVFDYTARKCGTTRTSLVSVLNNNGVLQGNIGNNMRNIRFGDRTEHMYALDYSVLFDVGELRPMCADNKAPAPLYKIPIGTADNYDIYYDIYPGDGKKGNNPFALITGATGTGKSTLCKTLAVNAALLNLSVVSIGLETSALDLECNVFEPGEDVEVSVEKFFEALRADLDVEQADIADVARELMLEQDYASYDEILNSFSGLVKDENGAEELINAAQKAVDQLSGFSWDKAIVDGKISQVIAQTPEETDKLLSAFFDYKVKHKDEKRYTILLFDEARGYSWNGKSALVSKIICQGRKFGIVGVFSSQYLNSDNGKNVASALKQIGTHFVFRPSDDIAALKQLGYKSSDDEVRNALNFLDTGEALASGNISTDICPLDYTVKFTVNTDDLNDIL